MHLHQIAPVLTQPQRERFPNVLNLFPISIWKRDHRQCMQRPANVQNRKVIDKTIHFFLPKNNIFKSFSSFSDL